jgi:hydroxymethylbilane synthase
VRGNVETRVMKVFSGEYDAIILASAGVKRLGMEAVISEYLSFEVMLPAPGQGALAVQCRSDDSETLRLLARLESNRVRAEETAERAFLAGLGGGCSLPVAARAICEADTEVSLQALVATPDGKRVIRVSGRGEDPATLGNELAKQALLEGAARFLEVV